MKKQVSLSIGALQKKYGDQKALEIAARIGVDAVDFDLCGAQNDYRTPNSLYSKGPQAVLEYYTALKKFAQKTVFLLGKPTVKCRAL